MNSKLKTALTCGILLLVAGCGRSSESPEQAIRSWIDAGEAAAEARDRPALMEMVSPAYSDPRGNERADLDQLLRVYFLRQQEILLSVHVNDIVMHADTAASVTVTVGMLGVRGRLEGLSADAYRFEFEIQREGDDWLLIAARWSPLGDPLL
jgi:hypothetical protein